MMVTLIMLVNQLRNSGPNRVMLDIARSVDRRKITPVVVSMMPDSNERPIARKFQEIGVKIVRFNYSKLELELKTRQIAKQLEKRISEEFETPVVQAHGYHPTLITSNMSLPHTVTIHCIASEDFITSKGKLLGSYMVMRFKHNLKKQQYPVVISRFMQNYYKNSCGDKSTLIYNGVNFMPLNEDTKILKEKLSLSQDIRLIVIPGGIHKRKNNIHTIEHLKKIENNNFLCIFIGLGDQVDELKEIVKGDRRFRFEGYKSNVREYLACADLYISSSLSEGMPLAALEALCMGVPSLLSDIPPHKEIVDLMNMTGVENFSLNDDSLAEKVRIYLSSDFDRQDISGRALACFGASTMAAKYGELIEKIANH